MPRSRYLNGLHWAVLEALRSGVAHDPKIVAAKLGLWRSKAAELLEDLERAGVVVQPRGRTLRDMTPRKG